MNTRQRAPGCAGIARRSLLACAGAVVPLPLARANDPARAAALRVQYEALAHGGAERVSPSLRIQSSDAAGEVRGWVQAVIDSPFDSVGSGLSNPAIWCEILNLHLNTKSCRVGGAPGATELVLRVTRLHSDAPAQGYWLPLVWHPPVATGDFFEARMSAASGPFGTGDYRIMLEVMPLPAGRCFGVFQYSYRYSVVARLATQLYLASTTREKVGFSMVPSAAGEMRPVGGMRGVVERNAMRYYLAIEAWLKTFEEPPARRFEARLAYWFDATERYARQLHELARQGYLEMKRHEGQLARGVS